MELHIRAVEASEIPNMDVVGKSDPYLKFTLSTSSQKWKTKSKGNAASPVWNEEFHLPITSALNDILEIKLYDEDISKDDLISTRRFSVSDMQIGQVIDAWYSFRPEEGVKSGGKIRLIFHLDTIGKPAFQS